MSTNGIDIFSWTSTWASETGLKLWAQEATSSTNLIAKDDADDATRPLLTDPANVYAGPSLYLARRQTAGRGRGSNTWISPENGALLSSWSFSVARVPQPIFAAAVGLALFEACSETWPLVPFSLKAPNDLYIESKKTAGILIETVQSVDTGNAPTERRTAVGIGMNIASAPGSIETATCLCDHLRSPLSQASWRAFLNAFLSHLKNAVLTGQQDHLNEKTAEHIKHALNLNPLLKEPILRVDELAQLHSASGIVRWHEL